ncbi:MAG: phospholipase [Chlorobi bacterium]|nr:phospholipase [Chlorobiota bacterium]
MKKSVSLVLSSGGARGMAHIGVIEELLKHNFEINAISGCSIGAVVGGIYASGKLEKYKKWVLNLDKYKVFKLMDFKLSSQGFIKGDKVFNELKKFIGDPKIEDLPIPITIVATDLYNQKEIEFKKGNLFKALKASSSIPSVIEPVIYKNMLLIDGGVINPLPIDKVINFKNDYIIAVNLNANIKYQKPKFKEKEQKKKEIIHKNHLDIFNKNWYKIFPAEKNKPKRPGYFTLLNDTFDLMQNRLTEVTIDNYKPDLLVNISKHSCGTFEFYKGDELIEAGRMAMRKCLKNNGL